MALDNNGVEISSSCSRSGWRQKKYDVFVSFRGEDTRKSFTDHLYAALEHKGIITFRDDEDLKRGEVIKPSLNQAIEESFSAIVVLSKNYATSTWCLDELLKILGSKKALGLHIFPIFYGVNPSDVRDQTGSFAEAFKRHKQKFAHDKVKVQRWRDALKEVADLAGWNSQDWYESELTNTVVEMVRSKLDDQQPFGSNDEGVVKTHLNDDGFVGIDVRIAEFESFLANKLGEVQFIGIWGIKGLGKTTLARAVYERIHKNYEVHVFLQNIREESAKDSGLISLQQKLLSHIEKRTKMEVGNFEEGRELIKGRLYKRKVLLVLDDVSHISQLENLAGEEGWYGKGSRIIITTRDQLLLVEYGVSQYKMNFLCQCEPFQIFDQKAFKGDQPNEDYLEPKPEEKKEEVPQTVTVVLGVDMHCETCGLKVKRCIQKMKGVESVEPDVTKSEVSVKGVFETTKLVEYVLKRVRKQVVIVKQEPEEKKEKIEEGGKEEKKGEEGEKNKEGETKGKEGTETEESNKVVELKKKNEYYYFPPRYVMEMYLYEIFSDENPNSCSVM